MKIGILTLPLHTNYGGILQAYALQTVLEQMGHDARHIVGKPDTTIPAHNASIRLGYLLKQCVKPFVPDFLSREHDRYTRRFIKRWIRQDCYSSLHEIKPQDYDAIIVGSDQIWRNTYIRESTFLHAAESCFLDFTKDWAIKRVAYAASFGTDSWEMDEAQTETCRQLIKRFDRVSVREDTGVLLCREHLFVAADKVLDPTLLLTKQDYLKLLNRTERGRRGVMSYILDPSPAKKAIVECVNKKIGTKSFETNKEPKGRGCIQPPLENWIEAFNDTDFVVTDSFHACVFAIIFNKPFLAIPNEERGNSRISSLLASVNQEFRLVSTSVTRLAFDELIERPNCDMSQSREASLAFIQKSLM